MVVLTLGYIDRSYRTELIAWRCGGRHDVINREHEPFFYTALKPSPTKLNSWDRVTGLSVESMKYLSTGKVGTCYRVATRRSWDVPAVSKEVEKLNKIPCYENHVFYKNRFFIDQGVEHDDTEPVFLTFDLEVRPPDEFTFPSSTRDPIISIAARTSTGERFVAYSHDDELGILTAFRDFFMKVNPDIVVTFYGDLFDYPYLFERMTHWHIPDFLTRISGSPCFKRESGLRTMWEIPGRCNFDLQYEVNADQRLYGLKNRKLETVGEYFRAEGMTEAFPIILPEGIYRTIRDRGVNAIGAYNMADVNVTHEIAVNVYYPLLISLARDVVRCDLQSIVWRTPYWFSETLLGRRFQSENILCDGTNEERFPKVFKYIDKHFDESKGKIRPTGALVELRHRGLMRNVTKFDFSSMYPSIIRAHNLSPETVHFEGLLKDIDHPGWHAKYTNEDEEKKYAELYDPNLRCIWCISIDKEQGILPEYERELMEMRAKERKDKTDGYQTRQVALKIAANSMFGNQRLGFASRANVLVSLAILAFGRQHMSTALNIVEAFGVTPIEVDTDGVYFSGLDEYQPLLDVINNTLPITMAFDGAFLTGLFYKAKNYALVMEDGSIIIKGISLKGTNRPRMCDKVVRHLVRMLHDGDDPLPYVRSLALAMFEPEDHMITTRLNKDVGDYVVNTPTKRLAKRLIHRGQNVRVGDELTYFWTVINKKSEPIQASDWHTGEHPFDTKKYATMLGASVSRVIGPLYFPTDHYSQLSDEERKMVDRKLIHLGCRVRDYLTGRGRFDDVVAATKNTVDTHEQTLVGE